MSGYGETDRTDRRFRSGNRVEIRTQRYAPYDDYWWLLRHLGGDVTLNPGKPDPQMAGMVSANGLDR